MNADVELAAWREQWQADETIPRDLQRKVERQSRLMKIGIACDILVTAVIGGGAVIWAWRSHDADVVPVAIAAWVFLAAAWIFVLLANRGLWSPSAMDAATFVELSIHRCRSALATIWFAAALFFAEIIFGLHWSYVHMSGDHPAILTWLLFGSARIDVVWVVTITFLSGLFWYRSKKRTELARLRILRREIDGTIETGTIDPAGGPNEEGR